MNVFSDDAVEIRVSKHAAERFITRVGGDMTIEEAKEAIIHGLNENGKLLLTRDHYKDGTIRYMEWMGLIFPLIPKVSNDDGQAVWLVKTTLLRGSFEHAND